MNPSLEAINYIINCCPHIGSFFGTGDVYRFLKRVASEMNDSQNTEIFPSRYKEHVVYAINMIASNEVMSSPSVIASEYLVNRFEFYFRILSGKLNGDGTWVTPQARDEAKNILNIPMSKCVSNVATTYKILKLNQSCSIYSYCVELDRSLYPSRGVSSSIKDIGDRIRWSRNRASHGQWGDISSEGIFYGLLTALFFYNQG